MVNFKLGYLHFPLNAIDLYLLTFLSNHVGKSSAKIIPVQNNFLTNTSSNIFLQETWGMPTIYTHHSGEIVYNHKTIEFGVVRERPATKYIYISLSVN